MLLVPVFDQTTRRSIEFQCSYSACRSANVWSGPAVGHFCGVVHPSPNWPLPELAKGAEGLDQFVADGVAWHVRLCSFGYAASRLALASLVAIISPGLEFLGSFLQGLH